MTQTTETTTPNEIEEMLAALVAQVERENAEIQDMPIAGPVIAFPSPFADA